MAVLIQAVGRGFCARRRAKKRREQLLRQQQVFAKVIKNSAVQVGHAVHDPDMQEGVRRGPDMSEAVEVPASFPNGLSGYVGGCDAGSGGVD
jgi:hypothetical protein